MIALLFLVSQDVEAILAEMDRRAGEVQTMTATYVHVKRLSLLDDETRSTGTVTFRRENRAIRWEEKDGVSIQQLDGDRYIAVYRKLKEVEVYTLDQRGRHLAAVMGAPDVSKTLKQDFDITLGDRTNGEILLKLAPKSDDMKKRVRTAQVKISAETFLITGASYVEPNDDSVEIAFQNLKINQKLDPRAFDLDLDALAKAGYTVKKH
jgi:outer membrane lipoprotein-sorting protein